MSGEQISINSIAIDRDMFFRDGPAAALQEALCGVLQADERLSDINILRENSLDIINEIEVALAALGIAVLVMTPGIRDRSPNIPRPVCDEVDIVIQVIENPLLNRAEGGTRIPGGTVAWIVAGIICAAAIEGALPVHRGLSQSVRDDQGVVVWNAEFTLALNI